MRFILQLLTVSVLILTACQPASEVEGDLNLTSVSSVQWNTIREQDSLVNYQTFYPLLNQAHVKQAKSLMAYYTHIEDEALIKAHIALIEGKPKTAYRLIRPIYNQSTDIPSIQRPLFVKAIASSNHWIHALDIATPTEIREILQTKSLKEVQKNLKTSQTPNQTGWLELSIITKSMVETPEKFVHKIHQWQAKYPNHEANSLLVDSNTNYPSRVHVGILLPLTGDLASIASSIREGLMAAHFSSTLRHEWSISFFDTNKYTLDEIYQKGHTKGIQHWIGPLEKEKVAQFTQMINTNDTLLALNELPKNAPSQSLSLSLSPEKEADQVATFSRKQGFERALIIEGNHPWSKRQAKTFAAGFTALGGTVVEHVTLAPGHYSKTIQEALHIDQSSDRYKHVQKLTRTPIKFISQPRPDIDIIFLAMGSDEALQVRPLLKFNLVGKINTIATSSIVNDRPNIHRDKDLNDIIFCDSMILHKKQNLSELNGRVLSVIDLLQSLNSQSFKDHSRFFGLGIDAYNIFLFRHRIDLFPSQGILGATGHLVKDGQTIKRQLDWATYRNGQIETLTQST